MATKKQYRKESKVFFYQYVQSFKPDCGTTPQEIHQMGIELSRRFEGYEVQIATHIDRDHWHNHLIVNSVSCETGLKLQSNEKDLEQLRTLSDEKYLKERMEQHFAQLERTQGFEQAAGDTTEADHTLSAAGQCHSDRGMGCHAKQPDRAAGTDGGSGAVYLDPADHTGNRESHPGLLSGDIRQSGGHAVPGHQRPAQEDFADSERQDRQVTGQSEMAAAGGFSEADGAAPASGYATVEARGQMDSRGAALLDSALYLA